MTPTLAAKPLVRFVESLFYVCVRVGACAEEATNAERRSDAYGEERADEDRSSRIDKLLGWQETWRRSTHVTFKESLIGIGEESEEFYEV